MDTIMSATSGPIGGFKNGNNNIKKELTILLPILAVLVILAFRPFGFRLFLKELQIGSIFSLLLVIGIVGVLLVIMQRLGIIFNDDYNDHRQ